MYERKAIGFTLPPSYRHHYDQDVAAVQAVLGDEAMTATGAIVNKDVPDGALAISRIPQDNKLNLARKLFDTLRAKKARQQNEDE